MLFEMTNGPMNLHGYINNILREALVNYPSVYMEHDLISSDSEEEYVGHD